MISLLVKLSDQHALPWRQNSCCFCGSYRNTKFNIRVEKVKEVSDTPKRVGHTDRCQKHMPKNSYRGSYQELLQDLNCHVGRQTGKFPFWGESEIFKFLSIFCTYLQKQILMSYCCRTSESKDFTKLNKRITIQNRKHSWKLWLQPRKSFLPGWVLLEVNKHF